MNTPLKPRAVVLLSGGLDSATVLAMAQAQGYDCYTLSFDYGQRYKVELQAATRLAAGAGVVEQKTIRADLATRAGTEGKPFRIRAPLQQLSKAEIIGAGMALGVDYSQTVSCYQADEEGLACGHCDSCSLRAAGFAAAGVADATRYVKKSEKNS